MRMGFEYFLLGAGVLQMIINHQQTAEHHCGPARPLFGLCSGFASLVGLKEVD